MDRHGPLTHNRWCTDQDAVFKQCYVNDDPELNYDNRKKFCRRLSEMFTYIIKPEHDSELW